MANGAIRLLLMQYDVWNKIVHENGHGILVLRSPHPIVRVYGIGEGERTKSNLQDKVQRLSYIVVTGALRFEDHFSSPTVDDRIREGAIFGRTQNGNRYSRRNL